ncbi:hypothetical protein V6N11_005611 [Hibiscus sabdariffa]|uniref:Uncharacterized protein n=1 Tax=Hibiscus sabdariffa TaxID=183260 RepID=A0ABR2RNA7_9ROSI
MVRGNAGRDAVMEKVLKKLSDIQETDKLHREHLSILSHKLTIVSDGLRTLYDTSSDQIKAVMDLNPTLKPTLKTPVSVLGGNGSKTGRNYGGNGGPNGGNGNSNGKGGGFLSRVLEEIRKTISED